MAHLLIVDDEQSICWGLSRLVQEMGHTAVTAATAEQGLESARLNRPDVIVLDVRLPGMDGLCAMRHFQTVLGPLPIIVITAFGDLATAVTSVRNGAFDYLLKPFDLNVAQRSIERAVQSANRPPASAAIECKDSDDMIVGSSPAIQEVFKQIALVAASDACVHIHGESGSGKELVARAIHKYSRRSEAPFIAVNVASLNPSLAESELFGHVRGAFTGADQPRKGLLEQAHGGTIFFDEIADIPLPLQVKLLRVLERGEISPVGGEQPVFSDFRLISATHQNLHQLAAEGAFRHDLYFRLIAFEIEIPPLRQRREDVQALAEHFLGVLSEKNHKSRPSLSSDAIAELKRRDWQGNVRELRNAIEHAMIVALGGTIAAEHLPPPTLCTRDAAVIDRNKIPALVRQWAENRLQSPEDTDDLYEQLLKIVEPPLIQTAMTYSGGQCIAAARKLGIHRTTLRKKLDEFASED